MATLASTIKWHALITILTVTAGLFLPLSLFAASATYTSTTNSIDVSDSFSLTDLDITLNLDADINALEVRLVNPAGTSVNLYTNHRAFGTRFRSTTLDDEASIALIGSSSSWSGRFLPNQSLSSFDGTAAQGTWTLELSYPTNTNPSLPIILHNWTLTFQGAEPSAIAGVKYHDRNGNGTREENEEGLSNWMLYIDANNDSELDSGEPTITTDSNGRYEFSNLDVRNYVIREIFQPAWFQTAPRGNLLLIRAASGQTSPDNNFGNIPEAETSSSLYNDTTVVPIQNDGEAVRARSTISVSDSFPVVDANVTIDANATLSDTQFALLGPDGTRILLFKQGSTGIIDGSQFRSTTFDDQAPQTIGDGDRPPFINTYKPHEFLSGLNQNSAGEWVLEAVDTNPANGTSGEIMAWTLELKTPLNTEPEPIVLVPGMMVSQNKKLLLEDKPGGTWDFAFGYRLPYKGLIQKLEAAGMKEGQELFIAHYDWRNPVADAANNYLKPIINQAKQATGSEKVDIVAHSMGGLVARAYIQGDNYQNDVDQLITLGTPHRGSADAYVAWEGGAFPEGWNSLVISRIENIERALLKTRQVQDLRRPETFRTFFPSLRDLLPIVDYVQRDNIAVPVGNLTEQNPFLGDLQATFNLIATRGIDLTTIAGSNLETLDKISLMNSRTDDDVALKRWRDGHANPDPVLPDSTAGDGRVLTSSAHVGTENITLSNAEHHVLANEAQDHILEVLGFGPNPPKLLFDLPGKLFDITLLSPVDVIIKAPDGKILSKDQNDFGTESAEYDDDPADPDDPKVITLLDPNPGAYAITLIGTGAGNYTAITCYADTDESRCSIREGTTTAGKAETFQVEVTADSFRSPPEDITALTYKLWLAIPRLVTEKHIQLTAAAPMLSPAGKMHTYASAYKQFATLLGFNHSITQQYFNLLKQEFGKFKAAFEQQKSLGKVDNIAIRELTGLKNDLEETGL